MRHFCSSATTVWCLHLFSRLSASTLSSNTAVVSGGGIYVANSQVTSTTNVIQDNRVVGSTIRQVSWATALGLWSHMLDWRFVMLSWVCPAGHWWGRNSMLRHTRSGVDRHQLVGQQCEAAVVDGNRCRNGAGRRHVRSTLSAVCCSLCRPCFVSLLRFHAATQATALRRWLGA